MALYMAQFKYTTEAWATLAKKPEDRRVVLSQLLQKLGGRMVSLYYSFGEYDGVGLFEVPDDIAAETLKLSTTSAGHLKEMTITRLFTVEETMEAMRKAGSIPYAAPTGR